MLLPNQYESLNKSTLILGADIIFKLKKREYNVEELFKDIRKKKNINVNQFLNTITFLWIIDVIDYVDFTISLKKINVS